MSLILNEFIEVLGPRVRGVLHGTAKLVVTGEGTVMMNADGARAGDGAADVTLSASEAVFRAIMDGSQNPVMAYMSGKLKVDGSPQRALKVSAILTGA
jgi:putative sterol carrier protein